MGTMTTIYVKFLQNQDENDAMFLSMGTMTTIYVGGLMVIYGIPGSCVAFLCSSSKARIFLHKLPDVVSIETLCEMLHGLCAWVSCI